MKCITTKIPNTHNKQDYALIHLNTFQSIDDYLDEILNVDAEMSLHDIVSEIRNEMEGIRRI